MKLKDILTAFDDSEIEKDVKNFMNSLSLIFSLMKGTLKATLNGDPACISYQEIVLSYPGYEAILSYRIAHELYKINQILLSRIITEEAHKNTGIDINPGATIGENLFIDHGTGIVIGETTVIGNNVKIYQGVTLGALSLLKGRELKGVKRHPTIEDNVTIYSNASILGGKTIIGKNSTIGANVYLVSSLEENTIVYLSESGIKKMRKQM